MCEKCNELRTRFQKAEGICERQTLWREYDKQRRKCEGSLGILAPKKGKAEVTVQKKTSKKKKSNEQAREQNEEKPTVYTSEIKPEHEKSAKEVSDALNGKPKEVPVKPTKPVSTGHCKYYYRGGLCANSQMDKPFCPCKADATKCSLMTKK